MSGIVQGMRQKEMNKTGMVSSLCTVQCRIQTRKKLQYSLISFKSDKHKVLWEKDMV